MNNAIGTRGRITVSNWTMIDIGKLRDIMRDVVVFHIETNQMQGTVTYWIDHPELDEIQVGEVVPQYDVSFTTTGAGMIRSFKRMPLN